MHKFIIIIFFNIISNQLFCQSEFDGTYINEYGQRLTLKDTQFILKINDPAQKGFYSDTIAMGNFSKINTNLIELNTNNSDYLRGMNKIESFQSHSQEFSDSIRVKFKFIGNMPNLMITIITDNGHRSFRRLYRNDKSVIKIPIDSKQFKIEIAPQYYNLSSPVFCVVPQLSPTAIFPVKNGCNDIEMKIPINGSFFSRYYIVGDYARITKDGIIWKGELFRRM